MDEILSKDAINMYQKAWYILNYNNDVLKKRCIIPPKFFEKFT